MKQFTLPRLLPVCFFILLFTSPLLAQKKGWQDVVYLKNGSIIRGDLLDDPAAGEVKIKIVGQNLLVFKAGEVAKIAREYTRLGYEYPFTSGYLNITEIGFSIGYRPIVPQFGGTSRVVNLSFQTFNGYQFYPRFALGLVTGIDTYEQTTLLPVGIGVRGDITKTRVRPFYSLDAGFALDWLHNPNLPADLDGGFFWSPALGIKFSSRKTHAFIINLGYRHQKATSTITEPFVTRSDNKQYKRLLIRFGMSF